MNFKEYGDIKNNTIMLLHGGGLSWWNYRDEAEKLQNDFHVIIPILDGHSESDRDFTSIEDNAQEIIEYIANNFNGHIHLIGGLSLGGQILLEILAKKNDICDFAIIESALAMPMKVTQKMIKPPFSMSYGLISKKWFSKMQFNSLGIKKELFDDYYIDTCKITKENMIAFMEANSKYEIKDTLQDTKARVLVIVGEKERPIMKKSADKINEKIGTSSIEVIPNYFHGELSINNPDRYISIMNELIAEKETKLNEVVVNNRNTTTLSSENNVEKSKGIILEER